MGQLGWICFVQLSASFSGKGRDRGSSKPEWHKPCCVFDKSRIDSGKLPEDAATPTWCDMSLCMG